MSLLLILSSVAFVASLTIRIFDPIVPDVARDLTVSTDAVALLATVYAISYALSQPILGPLGDALGKARVIKFFLGIQLACAAASIFATSIEWLYVLRFLAGVAGGGVIPVIFAMVGDRFAFEERQLALSRLLSAIIVAVLLGSTGSGLIASLLGWRAVMIILAVVSAVAFVVAMVGLRPRPNQVRSSFSLSDVVGSYRIVFRNPRAVYCYAAVCVEGLTIFGFLPFVAVLLERRGAGGIIEAGVVLAALGIGGLVYTLTVSRLLPLLGNMFNLMRLGGIAIGSGFVGLAIQGSWQMDFIAFLAMGFGFYSVHNSLQTQATELAPNNRGAAVAMHTFSFFAGQALGPAFYALVLGSVGLTAVALTLAIVLPTLALLVSNKLRRLSTSP
ncbi:MAG: MFS transporter [Hyphomicrobiaceae bacterium]